MLEVTLSGQRHSRLHVRLRSSCPESLTVRNIPQGAAFRHALHPGRPDTLCSAAGRRTPARAGRSPSRERQILGRSTLVRPEPSRHGEHRRRPHPRPPGRSEAPRHFQSDEAQPSSAPSPSLPPISRNRVDSPTGHPGTGHPAHCSPQRMRASCRRRRRSKRSPAYPGSRVPTTRQ